MAKRTPGFKSVKQRQYLKLKEDDGTGRHQHLTQYLLRTIYTLLFLSGHLEISNCVNEEITEIDGSNMTADFSKWREGRRVIKLGVLASSLQEMWSSPFFAKLQYHKLSRYSCHFEDSVCQHIMSLHQPNPYRKKTWTNLGCQLQISRR